MDPKNTPEKKILIQKIPLREIYGSQKDTIAQLNWTHDTQHETRPTKFSALILFQFGFL